MTQKQKLEEFVRGRAMGKTMTSREVRLCTGATRQRTKNLILWAMKKGLVKRVNRGRYEKA